MNERTKLLQVITSYYNERTNEVITSYYKLLQRTNEVITSYYLFSCFLKRVITLIQITLVSKLVQAQLKQNFLVITFKKGMQIHII
jgi:hypothetical protein